MKIKDIEYAAVIVKHNNRLNAKLVGDHGFADVDELVDADLLLDAVEKQIERNRGKIVVMGGDSE